MSNESDHDKWDRSKTLLLESLYEQVVEENPQLSELEAVRLTEQLFEDLIQ